MSAGEAGEPGEPNGVDGRGTGTSPEGASPAGGSPADGPLQADASPERTPRAPAESAGPAESVEPVVPVEPPESNAPAGPAPAPTGSLALEESTAPAGATAPAEATAPASAPSASDGAESAAPLPAAPLSPAPAGPGAPTPSAPAPGTPGAAGAAPRPELERLAALERRLAGSLPRRPWLIHGLWTLGVVGLALAVLLPGALRAIAPSLAVEGRFLRVFEDVFAEAEGALEGAPPDPWGRPWRAARRATIALAPEEIERGVPHLAVEEDPWTSLVLYSTGPDGLDQTGAGDDVIPALRMDRLEVVLAAWLREVALALAFLPMGWALGASLPRQRPAGELAVIAGMAAPAALCVGLAVDVLVSSARELLPVAGTTWVSPPLALAATCTLVAVVLCALLRLAGRPEGEPA